MRRARMREPASGLTHLAGAGLAVAVLTGLVVQAVGTGSRLRLLAVAVFGGSLVALYAASALYHLLPLAPRGVARLRRLDHAMVFVLIAGTYTPFCLLALEGGWRWGLLGMIWGMAAAGIASKLRWMDVPIWLSTGVYILMGWAVVPALPALARTVPGEGLAWLVVGGMAYSLGAVVHATGWPSPRPGVFGAHEVWHLFVLAGSACHVWVVTRYLGSTG